MWRISDSSSPQSTRSTLRAFGLPFVEIFSFSSRTDQPSGAQIEPPEIPSKTAVTAPPMNHLSMIVRTLVTAGALFAGASHPHAGELASEPIALVDLPGSEEASVGAPAPTIVSYVSYTYDYFHNVSEGFQTGGAGMGLLDVGFEADLERLFGWGGASFVVTAFAGHGSDFSANYGGDFGVASNIYHGNDLNLYNIYLQKMVGEGDSYFKVGQIAADDEFMGADAAGTLINSTFGPFNTQSGNMGAPIFPFAAPGAVVHYAPTEDWYLTVGIYAGLLEKGSPDNRGFDWRWGGGAGQALFAETGFVYDEAGSVFKLGGYYHTGEFEDFSSGDTVDGLGAAYAIVNQWILDGGGEQGTGVSAFLRGSLVSDEDRTVATGYIDAGINVDNVVKTGDAFAFGVSHTIFGDDYLDATPGVTNTETVLEATYRFPVNDYFSIQPDFQYIFDSHEAGRNMFSLGIRAAVEF